MESATCFFLALHRCLDGDLAAAEPPGRRAAELELELGNTYWRARTLSLLGAILFWRGQHADAQLILEQVIRPDHRSADKLASLFALSTLAAISARQGDPEAAERYAREAALTAHQRVTVIADLTSADLLASRGELAAAESAALAALDHARNHRRRLDTIAALVCLARIYTRAGRDADVRSCLDEAGELLATLPDPGILADLLADAERAAGPPEPTTRLQHGRTQRPDGLSAREAEVLRLLTLGHTNLEIAAKLVVSVHTVERHLQNAYRKIGVRNRADAAAYMARDGS